MKLAIEILTQRRTDLRKGIDQETYNVNYYQAESRKRRAAALHHEKEAITIDKQAERACLNRNEFQAQLNVIDSAIAKLER